MFLWFHFFVKMAKKHFVHLCGNYTAQETYERRCKNHFRTGRVYLSSLLLHLASIEAQQGLLSVKWHIFVCQQFGNTSVHCQSDVISQSVPWWCVWLKTDHTDFFFSRFARGSPAAACQRTGLLHLQGNMWSLYTKTPEHTFFMAKTMFWCNRYNCSFWFHGMFLYFSMQELRCFYLSIYWN